jgi:hypothetical protein
MDSRPACGVLSGAACPGPACRIDASPRPPQIRQGWPTRHYTADQQGHLVDQPDGRAGDIFLETPESVRVAGSGAPAWSA